MGLPFIRLATLKKAVWSSPKVNTESPIAIQRLLFTDLISDSLAPLYQGASLGLLNFHVTSSFTLILSLFLPAAVS